MKPCQECKQWSPHDALFCIECSAPFAATGATERLAPAIRDSIGTAYVVHGRRILAGTVFVPMPDVHVADLGKSGMATFIDHKRGT
jgi:hypothetical protein